MTQAQAASRFIPPLDDSVHSSVKDAIRMLYQKHYQLLDAVGQVARTAATPAQVNDALQNSAAKTQSFLTTIPGYNLFQAGSSSQLRQGQGSILPISSGSLQYDNSVANVIKWFFSGLTLSWPDKTKTPIPDTTLALPSVIVSGLAPASYFFYPYYNIGLQMVLWALAPGGVGNPAVAYSASSVLAAQIQNQDGNVSLAIGGITGTATGGGGGGGSGGGRRGYGPNGT